MKFIVRLFNFIIMGVSGLAIALMFITSTFTFNSRFSLDTDIMSDHFQSVVTRINDAIPATETDPVLSEDYINEINIGKVLGTNHVNLTLKFDLNFGEVNTLMGKTDQDLINKELIDSNVSTVFTDLHEPVEILTEYTARTVLRSVAKKEVYKQIVKSLNETGSGSTPLDVMEEVGMNDSYFRGFAKALYDAANTPDDPSTAAMDDGCSIEHFLDVIIGQLERVLDEADAATGGAVDINAMIHNPDLRNELKNGFINVITAADLIKEDGQTFVKVSKVSYIFLSKMLVDSLSSSGTVPASELVQHPGETLEVFCERLSKLYIHSVLPPVFYQIIGYVCLGLFIGIIVFSAIWAILFLITLIRTFSKDKPWTIFGAWFWVFGSLQVVLGLALTIFCKFYLPGMGFIKNALNGTPIQSFAIAPRTSILIPSMIFLGMIVFAIIYTIIAHPVKKEYKDKRNNKGPKPTEVIIHE